MLCFNHSSGSFQETGSVPTHLRPCPQPLWFLKSLYILCSTSCLTRKSLEVNHLAMPAMPSVLVMLPLGWPFISFLESNLGHSGRPCTGQRRLVRKRRRDITGS